MVTTAYKQTKSINLEEEGSIAVFYPYLRRVHQIIKEQIIIDEKKHLEEVIGAVIEGNKTNNKI